MPLFQRIAQQYRLRSAIVDVASLLQRARMQCIQNNITRPIQSAGNTQLYLDLNNDGQYNQGEAMVLLPQNITTANAGFPAIPAATLGFANPQGLPARFSGRGVPCAINGAVCTNYLGGNPVGFIYYLNQNINGVNRWGAVSISPAGQVKTWLNTSGAWRNI